MGPTQEEIDRSLEQWGEQQRGYEPVEPGPGGTPAIYDAGQRSQRAPIPESAFRPFQPGGDAGTLDPMVTGEPLPDEALMLHLQNQMGQMQLSTAERLHLQRLQNGRSAVQQDLASGNLMPQHAQQLMGMIDQQAEPLQIRASQLPIYQRRLQMMMQMQDMAQQQATMNESSRIRALGA